MIELSLPFPPTTNNLYANGKKGRYRTPTYDAWLKEAGWALNIQRPGSIEGQYRLTITAQRPDRRARDVDNLIKPLSDLLKKHGVIEDDSKALSVSAEWAGSEPVKGAQVLVVVRA
jgi:crossover junction endodeoxyribonuclease RusA